MSRGASETISRAKEVLTRDPENRAALRAERLAQEEKKALQDAYFAHAEKAMDNLRAAKENAAAMEGNGAAKGVRYEINPEYASDVDWWYEHGRPGNKVFVLGSTGDTLQKLGAKAQSIYMNASKINKIMNKHPEITINEIKRIPEVLEDPTMILESKGEDENGNNTRIVMFGSVTAQDKRPMLCTLDLRPMEHNLVIDDMQKVNSVYTKDRKPVDFVRTSKVMYVSENKNRTTTLLKLLGFQLPISLQRYGSIGTITYGKDSVKFEGGIEFKDLENAPIKKNIRFQLAAPVEVDSQKELVGEQFLHARGHPGRRRV